MDYMNVSGMVVLAAGGFAVGTLYGRRLAADAMAVLRSLESRVAAMEHAVRGGAGSSAASASQTSGAHAAALEKLAGAIEKHAAAIDDHGAATVAAAVESSAAAVSSAASAAPAGVAKAA